NTLAFYERIVSNGGAQCLAPAETFLSGLTGGGHGHGVKPPTLFGGQRFPVVQGIGDVVWRGFLHGPAENAEFLAKGRVDRHGLGGVLLKLGGRQAVGTKAAIGLFPERWSDGLPARAVDDNAQRRVVGRWCIHGAGAKMVEIISPVLADADDFTAPSALR